MKAKRFLLSIFAVCTAVCAFNASACDETESSSSPSSPTSSSSDSSSSSEEKQTTVSATEWTNALSPTAFVNFTATGRETETTIADGTVTTSFFANFATDKLKTTYTEDGFSYTVYTAIENGSVYMYTDIFGSGTYTKSDMGIDASVFPSAAYLSPASEIFNFTSLYSSFRYDEGTGSYTALRIDVDPTTSFENVTLKFENGVLLSYSASSTQTEDGTAITGTSSFTFSDYGTTTVTLPAIDSAPSVKGDGIVSQSEWAAAFGASALANVKMSCTLTLGDGTSDTMVIYFDESDIVRSYASFSGYDDANNPYTIDTDQYYIENYEYVYVSGTINDVVIGWTAIPENNNYELAQELRESLYVFANFYQFFTFDGYEATVELEEGDITTIRFNEQEQLVYFSDGEMTITLSQYGTIDNELPVGAR